MITLYDACKLVSNDIGMNIDSTKALAILQHMCIEEKLTKLTCDVIRTNWPTLWKEFIVKLVSGEYCNLIC